MKFSPQAWWLVSVVPAGQEYWPVGLQVILNNVYSCTYFVQFSNKTIWCQKRHLALKRLTRISHNMSWEPQNHLSFNFDIIWTAPGSSWRSCTRNGKPREKATAPIDVNMDGPHEATTPAHSLVQQNDKRYIKGCTSHVLNLFQSKKAFRYVVQACQQISRWSRSSGWTKANSNWNLSARQCSFGHPMKSGPTSSNLLT